MTEYNARAYESSPSPRIAVFKTVSTLRPQYFSSYFPKEKVYESSEFGCLITDFDLSHVFWRTKLDIGYISQCLLMQPGETSRVKKKIDTAAVSEYPRVRSLIYSSLTEMPTGDDLKAAYRILRRILDLANRCESGIEIHQARGLVPTDFNPYSLQEVTDAALRRRPSALYQQLENLLGYLAWPVELDIAVITLRNDVEFAQVAIIASLLKRRYPEIVIFLEAAGANEQFDFSNWVNELKDFEEIGGLIDYFLPKQDYRATLVPLVKFVLDRITPCLEGTANVVPLSPTAKTPTSYSLIADPVDFAFARHQDAAGIFLAGGRRTLIARLSPARCHWSACSFCTINSQHVIPAGKKEFDAQTGEHAQRLIRTLKARNVESLILTDEAIHPNVLLSFARMIIDSGVKIVYRARSRFTDDLTPDACSLLAASGCHYLGMGLESASMRVNALFNKHHGPPPKYFEILENLEAAGIPPHIYAILGFPTETEDEIRATRDLLVTAIRRSRYVTVSANNFYLMKGSAVAKKPGRWGIERISEAGELALTLDFFEEKHNENYAGAIQASQEIYLEEFCPEISDGDFAEGFWHFIDQAGIFYTQKTLYIESPYRDFESSHSKKFSVRPYFRIDEVDSSGRVLFCSWVTNKYVSLEKQIALPLDSLLRSVEGEVTKEDLVEAGLNLELIEGLQAAGLIRRTSNLVQQNCLPSNQATLPPLNQATLPKSRRVVPIVPV